MFLYFPVPYSIVHKRKCKMPLYENISTKEWEMLPTLDYPPNVERTISKMYSYGRKAIVPAGEVCSWWSAIQQVNRAFIKKEMPFRLRIVQGGYPNDQTYPKGYLVQLAKKLKKKCVAL